MSRRLIRKMCNGIGSNVGCGFFYLYQGMTAGCLVLTTPACESLVIEHAGRGSRANGCYISHGELDIARISYAGTIDWTNSGADIFTNGFDVSEDCVTAVDWNGDVYIWSIKTGEPVATMPNKAVRPSGESGGF